MTNICRPAVVALLFMMVALNAARAETHMRLVLNAESLTIIQHATQVEVYQVSDRSPDLIYGPVPGKTVQMLDKCQIMATGETRSAVILARAKSVFSSAETYGGGSSLCFSPAFAIRFSTETQVLTLLMCFHCGVTEGYVQEKHDRTISKEIVAQVRGGANSQAKPLIAFLKQVFPDDPKVQNFEAELTRFYASESAQELRSVKLHRVDAAGETSLMLAVMDRDVKQVKAFLQEGAPVDDTDNRGQTALMFAVSDISVGVAKTLLNSGANVNAHTISGMTPLMIAAYYSAPDVVETLLAAGAIVSARDQDGRTALSIAEYQQQRIKDEKTDKVVKLLQQAGAQE